MTTLAVVLLTGCSANFYGRWADRQAYRILDEKAQAVPGMIPLRLGGAAVAPQVTAEAGKPLPLAQALELAFCCSRDYLSRRENAYLAALDLTFERYLWGPRFSGALSGRWEHTKSDNERRVSGSSDFSVSQAIVTGADVTLGLATSFMRFLSGEPRTSASSLLDLAIRQPLWRGRGARVATENLTQAERDVIYELRSFVRFRRDFAVTVASSYYDVLQQRDVVENERVNMENLTSFRARAEMLAEAGRLPEFQVAQARQDELAARDRWVRATQSYETQLDEFKILLGLPVGSPLELDPGELTQLKTVGPQAVSYSRDDAVKRALDGRLDLRTAWDSVGDAERKVLVAKDALKPNVDLVLEASIGTLKPKKFWVFRESESSYGYGVDVNLPLDRFRERNAYRASLITLDRSKRSYDLSRDRVRQEVYNAWRLLDEARQSYDIQQRSLELAERRVDSTALLIDAGRADMRDLLESQRSLLDARNSLTRVLVDHRIARLQLWRDMDVLGVANGELKEEMPRAENGSGR